MHRISPTPYWTALLLDDPNLRKNDSSTLKYEAVSGDAGENPRCGKVRGVAEGNAIADRHENGLAETRHLHMASEDSELANMD